MTAYDDRSRAKVGDLVLVYDSEGTFPAVVTKKICRESDGQPEAFDLNIHQGFAYVKLAEVGMVLLARQGEFDFNPDRSPQEEYERILPALLSRHLSSVNK